LVRRFGIIGTPLQKRGDEFARDAELASFLRRPTAARREAGA
jgi:hypothetical protein